jgi:hypothetical protein
MDGGERAETYTVKPGDTLATIALQFDLSVSWLREINQQLRMDLVFPGDILSVRRGRLKFQTISPISVQSFDFTHPQDSIAGVLFIAGDDLHFDSSPKSPFILHLADYIESIVIVHPLAEGQDVSDADALFLLAVSYLTDGADPDSSSILYFTGPNTQLHEFNEMLISRATAVKSSSRSPSTDEFLVSPESNSPSSRSGDDITLKRDLRQIELRDGFSEFLCESEVNSIRNSLPYRFRNSNWRLCFQLSRDGTAYQTIFEKTEKAMPLVLFILTNTQEKVGSYLSMGLHKSRGYFGTGESFVFKLSPKCEVYRATRANEYFISTGDNELVIGGGGSCALWIDGNLLAAASGPCSTFGSPPLTTNEKFDIVNLEVWAVECFASARRLSDAFV